VGCAQVAQRVAAEAVCVASRVPLTEDTNFKKSRLFIEFNVICVNNLQLFKGRKYIYIYIFHSECSFCRQFTASCTLLPGATAPLAVLWLLPCASL
jgi:hypothetical protein